MKKCRIIWRVSWIFTDICYFWMSRISNVRNTESFYTFLFTISIWQLTCLFKEGKQSLTSLNNCESVVMVSHVRHDAFKSRQKMGNWSSGCEVGITQHTVNTTLTFFFVLSQNIEHVTDKSRRPLVYVKVNLRIFNCLWLNLKMFYSLPHIKQPTEIIKRKQNIN